MSRTISPTDGTPSKSKPPHTASAADHDLVAIEDDQPYNQSRSERLFERGFIILAFVIATYGLISAATQSHHGQEPSATPEAATPPAPSTSPYQWAPTTR